MTRACLALGYRRMVSYTLLGEAGTCYRAAGWRVTAVVRAERSLGRRGRKRAEAIQAGRKIRWETGPDAATHDPDAEALMRSCVGRVDLPEFDHGSELPLLRGVRSA